MPGPIGSKPPATDFSGVSKPLQETGRQAQGAVVFKATHNIEKLGTTEPTSELKSGWGLSSKWVDAEHVFPGIHQVLGLTDDKKVDVHQGKDPDTFYARSYTETVAPDYSEDRPGATTVTKSDMQYHVITKKPEAAAGAATPAAQGTPATPATSAEKMAGANAQGDQILAKLKASGRLSESIPAPTEGNEQEFWKGILKAEDNKVKGGHGQVSELDQFCFGLSVASCTRPDGTVDVKKAQEKSQVMKQALLLEATRNTTPGVKTVKQINSEITAAVAASHHGGPGSPTNVADPAFLGELEKLTGKSTVEVTGPKQIKSNSKAAQARIDQIKSAKHDVSCAVWKIYDDNAGHAFAAALKEAAQSGKDVKLMVDGNVASRDPGSTAILNELEAAGVKVLRFHDERGLDDAQNGMHGKMLLTDVSAEARAAKATPKLIEGGRNAGNPYLTDVDPNHPNDPSHGWSDSDHQWEGSGAMESYRTFGELWNKGMAVAGGQVSAFNKRHPTAQMTPVNDVATREEVAAAAKKEPGVKVKMQSLVDVAGKDNNQEISKALVKCIEGMGAGDKITAIQAYFLGVPAVEKAYADAMARGATVTVYTNGATSNDVPILDAASRAALERLENAHPTKFSTFVKTGHQTMHDKLMLFESGKNPAASIAMAMSWNQHQRSQVFEAEVGKVIVGSGVIADAKANLKTVKFTELPKPTLTETERALGPMTGVVQPQM
jgi:phosphatidylserine/phosphatidylglycerophosphate/cardiolipin synthase-like enzyme